MTNLEIDKNYNQLIVELNKTKPNKDTKFLGEFGLTRTKLLLKKLGNPQEKINVIHIAGTSGKGSTAYILSTVLLTLNKKIGLSLSPHIFDIRERFQINNIFISKEKFINYLSLVNEKSLQIQTEIGSYPGYFEILSALTFLIFKEENVDYAIIETGLGGLLDCTNVVENSSKISVITKIGLDHTHILGNTLEAIAYQKIGIVNKKSIAFSVYQRKNILNVFKSEIIKKQAKLFVNPKLSSSNLTNNILTYKNKLLSLNKVYLSLNGYHQIENAKLALSVFTFICEKDNLSINKEKVINSLSTIELIGRFSIKIINNKIIIFDGAHNPQKMKSLIQTLKNKYPNQKFNFLFGLKNNKELITLIRIIKPYIKTLILTKLQGDSRNKLKKIHFIDYNYIVDPVKALDRIIKDKQNGIIVVTGSFFLISKFEKYFIN